MSKKRRDRSPIPTRREPPLASVVRSALIKRVLARSVLRELEDRRAFHPLSDLRPVRALVRTARRLVPARKPTASRMSLPEKIGFAVPKKVVVCVRRKQRREVIHALRLRGKGASSPKRRNIWSDVKC